MEKCSRCGRACGANRTELENKDGFCRMPLLPKLSKACLHFWEEPCISGQNGSGTVFFSGCSLRCVFCQNYEISHEGKGKIVSYERLAEIFYELEQKGAHNINLVNPTHYIDAIEKAVKIYKPNIPLVYNSGGFDDISVSTLDFIDVYLFDLKFKNNEKAIKYASADGYFDVATKVIKAAHERLGTPVFSADGIMQKGVIIRHLLLPSSTKDAIEIIDWAEKECPKAVFSLMSQYVPFDKAEKYKEINRRVTKREYDKVCDYLAEKQFFYTYIQDTDSSSTEYIPVFDLEGV